MSLRVVHNGSHYTSAIADRVDEIAAALDVFWLLQAAVTIFVMQAGFALIETGSVRMQGARDIMMKNLLDASIGLLLWWCVGAPISGAHGNGFIGADFTTDIESDGKKMAQWLVGYMYAASSVTIVSGAVAERAKHSGYIMLVSVNAGLLYPVASHWLWAPNGWLSIHNPDAIFGGAMDFAGSGVVHLHGGVLALVACLLVGPRMGRFDERTREPVEMRSQSSSFIMLGTFFLWVGWLGFNMGSTPGLSTRAAAATAAKVGMRTMLAGSAGCVAVTGIELCRSRSLSLPNTCFGILSGLVAITAPCAVVSGWAAVLIGAVGGSLYYLISDLVLRRLKADDVVDAFAIHGVNGAWGLLAVGLFADGSSSPTAIGVLYGGDGQLLLAALLAIAAITLWAGIGGGLCLVLARRLGVLRVSEDESRFGLDVLAAARPARGRPARARWAARRRADHVSSSAAVDLGGTDSSVHASQEYRVRQGVIAEWSASRSSSATRAARAAEV